MINKKAQSISIRLLLSISILLFGVLGVGLWSFGIALESVNSIWIGKIILGSVSLLVLILERFLQ